MALHYSAFTCSNNHMYCSSVVNTIICYSDILQYLSNKSVDSMVAIKSDKPDHQSVATFTDIQLTSMRKTIAKRLTESKVNVNYYIFELKTILKIVIRGSTVLLTNHTMIT